METLAPQMIVGDEKLRQVLSGRAAADRTNLSELCKRIDAAQAKSAAEQAAFERELAGAPPSVESN